MPDDLTPVRPSGRPGPSHKAARSSRRRYRAFIGDYRQGRLDDVDTAETERKGDDGPVALPESRARGWRGLVGGTRRAYLREYLRWLWPHRSAVAVVFACALVAAGLQMAEPLFMRFIIDRVLLNADLDPASRLTRLHAAGALFLAVILASNLVNVLRDYRQRLLNVRVMLSLRRALFDRLLHLPLPKLWDMKTGGILSRLTGDIDTTTGLLQMAVVSPAISIIRLAIAVVVLLTINWRLALTALAIIPGVVLMSFTSARRIRPIYRSMRKDAEAIDGRVGETFSGIRVVRAFGRELRELGEYLPGRHVLLRKELFAHRRAMMLWTSWGVLLGAVNVVIRERRYPTGSALGGRSRPLLRRSLESSVGRVRPRQPPVVDLRRILIADFGRCHRRRRRGERRGRTPSGVRCYDDSRKKGDAMAQGLKQKLDYDDLAHTPDDGKRYELLDGALVVSPSPRPLHQRVSKRLQRQLEAYFEDSGLGEVFDAPVDVILTFHDVVVPDLVVVTTPPQITERAIEGPPAIIVEVLSPTTRSRDRKLKAERYAALGVPHYWIVDPAARTLECYRLEHARYATVLTAESPTLVTHPDWPGLTVDLGAIWH